MATFSSYGVRATHIFAPGDQIYAPMWYIDSNSTSNYVWRVQAGTSSASPFVAAAASMMMNINPGLTPEQVGGLVV